MEELDQILKIQIKDKDDHAGYKLADQKRKEIKNVRVGITKTAKALRQDAIDYQKSVIAKEKSLIDILDPVENHLEAVQEAYEKANEEYRKEQEAKAAQKSNERINQLLKIAEFDGDTYTVGTMSINSYAVINASDQYFNDFMKDATELREALNYEQEKMQKMIDSRKKLLSDSGFMHLPPNYVNSFGTILMHENDIVAKNFDDIFIQAQTITEADKADYLRKQDELKEAAKLREENKKLIAEKQAAIEERVKSRAIVLSSIGLNFNGSEWYYKNVSIPSAHIIDMDNDSFVNLIENKKAEIETIKKTEEKLREEARNSELQEAAKRALEEEALKKQQAIKEEEQRKAILEQQKLMAPDRDKFEAYINEFNLVKLPEMTTDKGKNLVASVKTLQFKFVSYIKSELEKWPTAL